MAVTYVAFVRPPVNTPRTFLARGRQPGTSTVVVAAGASITHASLSADYVGALRRELGGAGYEFVNAGVNGTTSAGLVRRLDEIIACRPDVITILIGTNDVRAHQAAESAPTRFRTHLDSIVTRLQAETSARIALLSLPPLGEDTASERNRRVREYNAIIRAVAAERHVAYLPVYETLAPLLPEREHVAQPDELPVRLIMTAALRRYLGRQRWDEVAAANGLVVLTDQIHLSDRGGAVVTRLVWEWLQEAER